MHKKSSLTILLLMLISVIPSAQSAPSTSVYVDPETCNVGGVGITFTVSITVAEVTNLWGWELNMFYNSTHLNGTDIEEGEFLKTAGETFFWTVNLTDNYNATHGYIRAFCALTHVMPGADGTGRIANVAFKSKTMGRSILDMTITKLKDSNGEYISHETRDGTIIVSTSCDFDYDGDIDQFDFWYFCGAFIDYYKIPWKDPRCDFDSDCDIDQFDFWYFCGAFIDYYESM